MCGVLRWYTRCPQIYFLSLIGFANFHLRCLHLYLQDDNLGFGPRIDLSYYPKTLIKGADVEELR